MVKNITLITLLLLIVPLSATAKPSLLLITNTSEVQIGHHVDALLYGIDLHSKLIEINLQPLEERFGVLIIETVEGITDDRWPGQTVQLMNLKLYPRKIGHFDIPSLIFEELRSKPKEISVLQGTNVSNNIETDIHVDIGISTSTPWQREQVFIEIELLSTDKYSSLQFSELIVPGFEIYPLSNERKNTVKNGRKYSALKVSWALFPLVSGKHTIDVPAIEYHKYGKKIRTYYLPKQIVHVRPLPTYIPPTMPVGKISISSLLPTANLLYPNNLYYWELRLSSEQSSPNWTPGVTSQLISNNEINFFSKNTTRKINAENGRLNHQVIHQIPFKPTSNGWQNFPEIRFQYFDPENGKITTVIHHTESIFSLNFIWRTILTCLIIALALVTITYFYRIITSRIRKKILYNSAIKRIEKAETFLDLRATLHQLSRNNNEQENLTIQAWASQRESSENNIGRITNQLSQACYGKKPEVELNTLRHNLLDII